MSYIYDGLHPDVLVYNVNNRHPRENRVYIRTVDSLMHSASVVTACTGIND